MSPSTPSLATGAPHPFTEAFGVLFRDCLRVRPQEDVLVLIDESSEPWRDALVDAALEADLRPLFTFFPKRLQLALMERKAPGGDDSSVPLPRPLRDAFYSTRAVLNLLDGDLATSSLRGAVLNIPRPKGCRLAHVPGLSPEILRILLDSPIERIEEEAELLAWAFGEAWQGELITRLPGERTSHTLHFQLEGWHCDPLPSTGVIYPDSWGNVPPGETFVCPEAVESIHGAVVIDGSVPGMVLEPEDAAVLHFRQGRLVDVDASKGSKVRLFLDQERQRAAERRDGEWDRLAEIGVGLNPAIRRLTGNSLFDEKAAGTMHVAIGDSSIFDGPVVSETHADMVTRQPDLVLDGRRIVDGGRIDTGAVQHWRAELEIPPLTLQAGERLALDDARIENKDDRLMLRLCRNGRVGYVQPAVGETCRRLWNLVQALPRHRPINARVLESRTRAWSPPEVAHLLGILRHYQIVNVRRS